VILCGGLGLRLRPVIQDRPKCLAPIAGHPFLEWPLANVRRQGFTNAILCLGYGSEQVLEFLQKCKGRAGFQPRPSAPTREKCELRMQIRHVIEQQPLGTAGGLRNAAPLVNDGNFLAMNGDTILEVDLKELLCSHMQRNALATIALRPNPEDAARYGGVTLSADGRIVRFSEKGQMPESHPHSSQPAATALPSHGSGRGAGNEGRSFINGGVYAFSKRIFELIPQPPASASLEKDTFPSIIGQGFYGFPCDGYFVDIGIPEDYERAQTELPERFKLW
jgi:D-glycero-alpha-D-manno-heptose 1-phosphate guanylyltransferase